MHIMVSITSVFSNYNSSYLIIRITWFNKPLQIQKLIFYFYLNFELIQGNKEIYKTDPLKIHHNSRSTQKVTVHTSWL